MSEMCAGNLATSHYQNCVFDQYCFGYFSFSSAASFFIWLKLWLLGLLFYHPTLSPQIITQIPKIARIHMMVYSVYIVCNVDPTLAEPTWLVGCLIYMTWRGGGSKNSFDWSLLVGYLENPLDPLDPRPSTLDLIKKNVCLYNYNFCIITTFRKL